MKMRKIASLFGMALMMCSMFVVAGCGSSSGTKKQKGIVLQEGDRATVTNANGYTTIEFPAELSGDDVALYDTDLLGYLLKSNAPISTSGSEYDTYRIYYYMHNSKEWLPYLTNSKEKKSDSGFQNEIQFGENYYLFIDITLRD